MHRFQQHHTALGSDTVLTILAEHESDVTHLFESLWHHIDEFDQTFSRFKKTSELSLFNQRAGHEVPISQPFHDFLATCIQMQQLTDGLFNPLILSDLQRAGYIGSWPHPETFESALDYRDRHHPALSSQITLYDTAACIPAETALDSGGIGKGYLLDQLQQYLSSEAISDYWLSLGGDILYSGHDTTNEPWPLMIMGAINHNLISVQTPELPCFSLATSGIMKRAGTYHNQSWHHIIDPRTGKPAISSVLSASVIAPSATLADVLATSFVIDPYFQPRIEDTFHLTIQTKDGTITNQLYTKSKETSS